MKNILLAVLVLLGTALYANDTFLIEQYKDISIYCIEGYKFVKTDKVIVQMIDKKGAGIQCFQDEFSNQGRK